MSNWPPVLWLRTILFYVGYVTSTVLWGTALSMLALFVPHRLRFGMVIVPWVSFVIWWLKVTCGIHVKIQGREHISQTPGILFMKHMSTWDALYSQLLVYPQTTVIKRKLLWIPCFGWAFWVTKPITIDRNQRMSTLKQMISMSSARLSQGFWVTMFPEGTRVAAGQVGRFQRGGAMLARSSGAPTYFVAHNGGLFWRRTGFAMHPGTIDVRISAPHWVGDRSADEFNQLALDWMRREMAELDPTQSNSSQAEASHAL